MAPLGPALADCVVALCPGGVILHPKGSLCTLGSHFVIQGVNLDAWVTWHPKKSLSIPGGSLCTSRGHFAPWESRCTPRNVTLHPRGSLPIPGVSLCIPGGITLHPGGCHFALQGVTLQSHISLLPPVGVPVPVEVGGDTQPMALPWWQGSPSLLGGLEASHSAEPSWSEVVPSLSEGLFSPTGPSLPSSIAPREPAKTQRRWLWGGG